MFISENICATGNLYFYSVKQCAFVCRALMNCLFSLVDWKEENALCRSALDGAKVGADSCLLFNVVQGKFAEVLICWIFLVSFPEKFSRMLREDSFSKRV